MKIHVSSGYGERKCTGSYNGNAFRGALQQLARKPFRMEPYFDPGVWGGQWMKENFGLDASKENFAWSF